MPIGHDEADLADFLSSLLGTEWYPGAEETVLDSLQRMELIAWLTDGGVAAEQFSDGRPETLTDAFTLLAAAPVPQVASPPAATGTGVPARTLLHTDWFALRPVTPEFEPFLYELSISEEVGFRWRFRGAVPSQETFRNTLWGPTLVQFVVLTPDGRPVGHVVAYNADSHRGIAYVAAVFVPDVVMTGLPAAAVDLFVRYVFQVWNFRKLYLEMPEFNYTQIASGAGRRFDVEGVLKDFSYYDGRYWDEYLLAICRHHLDKPVGAGDHHRGRPS